MATPLATIVQLILELDGSGLWFPTIPDEEEVILVIVALISGFISMAITTEHIWADKSATYSLDRHILVVPGTKKNFCFELTLALSGFKILEGATIIIKIGCFLGFLQTSFIAQIVLENINDDFRNSLRKFVITILVETIV